MFQLVTVPVLDSTSVMDQWLISVVIIMMVVTVPIAVVRTEKETPPFIVSAVTSGLEMIAAVR